MPPSYAFANLTPACRTCGTHITGENRPNKGLESPGRVRVGRPPMYCSNACKKTGWRLRHRLEEQGVAQEIAERVAELADEQGGICPCCRRSDDEVGPLVPDFDNPDNPTAFTNVLCRRCSDLMDACDHDPQKIQQYLAYLERWRVIHAERRAAATGQADDDTAPPA